MIKLETNYEVYDNGRFSCCQTSLELLEPAPVGSNM